MATTRKTARWGGTAVLLALAVASSAAAWGDLITLKDGRTLSGTMSRRGDVVSIQTDDGAVVKVKPDDVLRTTLISRVTPEEAANAEWTRRAALIRQAPDLETIVNLHKTFLDKYADASVSATVRGSLADYLSLQRQHGVKFRGRWMPAAQVDVTLRQWQERAAPAAALYRNGQLRPALEVAHKILEQDNANPDALAIAGLSQFRLNDLLGSLDTFSALADADAGNVLAENNLGVVLFMLKRQPESLVHYAKALDAIPPNRLVVDNIAEALHAYTGSKTTPVYDRLVRQYEQAEARVETEMAKNGLYRYGSTWVGCLQYQQLTQNLQAIKAAMVHLNGDYQTVQHDSQTIGEQVKQATDEYNSAIATLQYLNGALIDSGGDPTLLNQRSALVADLERLRQRKIALEQQRDALVGGTPQMFADAARLKSALGEAERSQFSGLQRVMDLGEADHPPAPLAVKMPAPTPPPSLIPQPIIVPPPVVINNNADDYQRIYNTGSTLFTPIFVPLPRDGRHYDHDHDGHGDHDGRGGHDAILPIQGPVAPSSGMVIKPAPPPPGPINPVPVPTPFGNQTGGTKNNQGQAQ